MEVGQAVESHSRQIQGTDWTYTVNGIVADVLATQWTRASPAVELTQFPRNIPVPESTRRVKRMFVCL